MTFFLGTLRVNISNHCPAESIYMQLIFYAPANWLVWGIVFHIVPPCMLASGRNVLFPQYLEESFLEFLQTLQTYTYL